MSTAVSETAFVGTANPAPGFLALLRQGFKAHALLLAIPVLFGVVLQTALVADFGTGMGFSFDILIAIIFAQGTLLFTVLLILWAYALIVYEKPASPLRGIWNRIRTDVLAKQQLASIIPTWIFLIAFTFFFTAAKSNIERFKPFSWDQTFDHWDAVLHFGFRPWELLQPIFGYPIVSFLVNLNYNAWFLVLIGFWAYYMAIAPRGVERTSFFLAFGLTWMIGGGLMATLLSSAGPCFYGRIGLSPDPYAGLMQYLDAASAQYPLLAVQTQDLLWQFHGTENLTGGISAMPSMHNATVLLFVLATANRSKFVRGIVLAHAILIFLGSIHFGWHYAVDAYIGGIIVLVLWPTSHWLAKWWESDTESRSLSVQPA
jgi:PAP2 superfamily